MSGAPHGLLAEFRTDEALVAAIRAARREGYRRMDAYGPYPVPAAASLLGHRPTLIPLIAVAALLVGGAVQYALQYYLNAVAYPLNVGGRPLHSWPSFVPATIIVGIMWAAAGAMLGMLALSGLPRLHHPVFDEPRFARVTRDRFFLCIRGDDRRFDRLRTADFLAGLGGEAVREVGA